MASRDVIIDKFNLVKFLDVNIKYFKGAIKV